jgi:DNA-directed RNA polymerase subunit RPC12/RpoP
MELDTTAVECPTCKKPLQAVMVSDRLGACAHCGKRVLMDERYREALAIATANEGWIEKIFWKEDTSNTFLALFMFFFLDLPMIVVPFGGFFVLVLGLVFKIGWLNLSLIAAGLIAAFVILALTRKWIRKILPNQFVTLLYFIVSSRGMIILGSYRNPSYLPWPTIVGYSWNSHVGSMTSQMIIHYATAKSGVATVILEGEEKVQPLGELVEILDARLPVGRQIVGDKP